MSQNLSRRLLNKRVLQPNFNHLVNNQREPVKKEKKKKKVSCAPVKQMKTTLAAFAPRAKQSFVCAAVAPRGRSMRAEATAERVRLQRQAGCATRPAEEINLHLH